MGDEYPTTLFDGELDTESPSAKNLNLSEDLQGSGTNLTAPNRAQSCSRKAL